MSAQRPGAPPGGGNPVGAPALGSIAAPTGQADHHHGSSPENSVRAGEVHPPGTKRIRPGVETEADPKTTGADVLDIIPRTTDAQRLLTALRRAAPTGRPGCPAGCPLDHHEHDRQRGLVDYSWSPAWRMSHGRPELVALRDLEEARR